MGLPLLKLKPLEFDWDTGNADKNLKKHGVGFKECEEAFFDPSVRILRDKEHSQKENRFVAFGRAEGGRKLFIVFTLRSRKIRVISARDQSRKERRFCEHEEKP